MLLCLGTFWYETCVVTRAAAGAAFFVILDFAGYVFLDEDQPALYGASSREGYH